MYKINLLELKSSELSSLFVVAAKDQISRDLEGEAVILNLKSGMYCGLSEVGARIWQLLQESTSVKEIRDTLLGEYEVEPDRCERELLALLQDMADNGLIEVKGETDT
ncbi:MAG: PqqD family protein [Proteobacteria bacterium]|nr:PqqD family protein [Pseudomonadota bacterium]